MRSTSPCNPFRHRAVLVAICVTSSLFAGCVTSSRPAAVSSEQPRTLEPTAVIRSGRYGLIELSPEAAQKDLMLQVIDITVPAIAGNSVGDALRYALLHSGYQLCDGDEEMRALDALPLPAAHSHLGPLTLRDALRTLVGPAWQMQTDDATRRVCFTHRNADPSEHP